MKTRKLLLVGAMLVAPVMAGADVVVEQEQDTIVGKGVGGWLGVLVGGAAGGPAGAVAAGALGAWLGGEAQENADLGGTAYRVQKDDGSVEVVRSPNRQFEKGDKVAVVNDRLIAAK